MTQMTKTLEQRIYDGNRAREVLENEVFQQVFADIEQEISQAWSNSPVRDEVGREKLFQHLTSLKKVKALIVATLESGKLAELDLNHKRTLVQRARDGINSLIG